MNVFKALLLTLGVIALRPGENPAVQAGEPVDGKLVELDRLRSGLLTPLDEVERRAGGLLKEYSAAEDQGKIYYQLAHTYAQSGIGFEQNAKRVVEYSKEALECPVDPIRKLHLYNYLGDGIMLADRSRPRAQRRREAAQVYLKGLKEAQKYKISDQEPKEPELIPPTWAKDDPLDEEHLKEHLKKWNEQQMAARRQWLYDRDMFQRRRVLVNQIVYVYTMKPYAATELAQLATEILGDVQMVDLLLKRLEERGARRDD